MAHGIAVEEYRKTSLKAPIGITFNPTTPRPATDSEADKKAADIARAFNTEVFIFPCLGKGYPELVTKDLGLSFPVKEGDLKTIAQPIDFIGVNFYQEAPAAYDKEAQFNYTFKPSWQNTTAMNWYVTPAGLGSQLEWIAEVSKLPIYITENGCAYEDTVTVDGRVHDPQRVKYLQQHLSVCADLIKKGVPLKGYYVWSLLDNFEWAFGYGKRFGIVHVDFKTLKRTIKDSAYFLRDVIAGYGDI
jgi:beta-glucosidase